MNPRLIRANIALFQGKRSETRRLLDEYLAEQPDARRSAMVMWLDAHSQPRQAERLSGMNTLVENAPPDDAYHRMAKNYLADEQHYAALLDTAGQRRTVRPWQIAAGIAVLAVVMIGFVLLGQAGSPPVALDEEETPTQEATAEPTITPLPTETPIVQNTPLAVQLANGNPPTGNYELDGGSISILAFDPAVRGVIDSRGVPQQPVEGATFYGFELQFQCFLPICNNVPQAELFARLDPRIPDVMASDGLFVAGQESLAGRAALGGLMTGWVVFELPRNNPPTALVVWPLAPEGSSARPTPIVITLPR